MADVEVRGARLEFRELGAGEPVVLVHGSASDLRTWQDQADALSKRFRVVAYSRRYHWPNAPIEPDADYSMVEHAEDLAALLPALDAEPAHLVGHSYGGGVCLLLALERPQAIRSLVLVEPPMVGLFVSHSPKPSELLRLLLTRPRTALAVARFGASTMAPATRAARKGDMARAMEIFGRGVLRPEHFERLSRERREQIEANAIRAEFLGPGLPRVRPEDVARVRIPTLLLEGDRSPKLFHRIADRLEELIPGLERETLPGASHNVHEDAPESFQQVVTSFLERGAAV